MADDILVKRNGEVLEVTLNRPAEGNGATDFMAIDLAKLLKDPGDVKLVLLRGAGNDFCIGRASSGRLPRPEGKQGPIEALERRDSTECIFECYNSFRKSPVPIIGVVQGKALGFGCSIAALCDVTIAAESATFQVPEMLHNIMPTMVASALIDRVPRKAMTYLIWSSEVIDAAQALQWGIVSKVSATASLELNVRKVVDRMVATPRAAVHAVKEYARVAVDMPISGAVDFARNLHATINSSSELLKKGK